MDEPGEKTIRELMSEIAYFDCQPAVYRVFLAKTDYETGFDAVIMFRSTHPGALSSITAHDDDPQVALTVILRRLQAEYGKCPHCGGYQNAPLRP